MPGLVIGALAACAASILYAAGIALQAVEARAAPREQALRLSLFRRLVVRPRWLAGTALGLFGWAVQAFALVHAPLTLVQPLLGTSMVFLLAASTWFLRERLTRADVLAVAAIAVGAPLLASSAPHRVGAHAGTTLLAVSLAVLGGLALVPLGLRAAARSTSLLVPIAAGLAYSWDSLATKFASDDYAHRFWLGLGFWFVAMNVASGLGTLAEMSALQARPVAQVAPLVFALTTFVPVALAPLLAHEWWPASAWRELELLLALLLTGGGALALARSEPVVRTLTESTGSSSGTGLSRFRDNSLINAVSD